MTTKTEEQAQQLLKDLNSKTIPSDGLLYAHELFALTLDYGLASLKPLDKLLKQLHQQGETPNSLMEQEGGENFILMVAVYLIEVVVKQTKKSVQWYNYDEAVNRLSSDYGLERNFYSSIVAVINGNVCLPLGLFADILNGRGHHTCVSYVEERCQVVSENHETDQNEWCKIYLDAIRNKKYMPGGNAYRKALELITFDDSFRSVEEIDRLLLTIKKTEQLNVDKYKDFITNTEKTNALLLIGFYLGMLIAKHSREVIKWFSFDEYKQLIQQPDLERRFEMHATYRIGNMYQHPLEVLTAILFDPDYDTNNKEYSCIGYVKRIIGRLPNGNVTYFPSNTTPTYSEQPVVIAEPLTIAMKDAGFLAAMATFHVQDGGMHQPTKLNRHGEKSTLISLMGDNAVDLGMQDLERNPEKLPYQSFAYDMYANLPTGRTDAFAIEIRGYGNDSFQLSFIVPYQKKDKDHDFQIHSVAMNMEKTPFQPSKMQAVIDAFYEGAFGFVSPYTKKSLWKDCFTDVVIPELDTQPATSEFLDTQEQRFIETLAHATPKETSQPSVSDSEQDEIAASYRDMIANIDVPQLVDQLPLKYRSYLQVVPPPWMKGDELYSQITAMPSLYRTGKVVWAALVQANSLMFKSEGASCPGEIVFDPTGQTDVYTLHNSAKQLFALKGTTPEQEDQRKYAEHLTDERTRLINFPFPQSLAPLPLRMSSVWFWRMHLPDGILTLPYFPIIISEQTLGEAIILPSLFWPKVFKEYWYSVSKEKNNGQVIDLEATVIRRMDEGKQDLPESMLEPRLPLIFNKSVAAAQRQHDPSTSTADTAKPNTSQNQGEILVKKAKDLIDNPDLSLLEKKKALEPLFEAARLGNMEAMTMLAYCYGEGFLVEKDEKNSRDYLLKLAHRGDANACVAVGLRYFQGTGMEVNLHEARHWVNIAAKKGHADAASILPRLDQMIAEAEMAELEAEVKKSGNPLMPKTWLEWGVVVVILILIMRVFF